jgi:hypothetical protein
MKISLMPILITLILAVLLISSSFFLKGNSIGDWVDAGIYIIGVSLAFHYFKKSSKICSM